MVRRWPLRRDSQVEYDADTAFPLLWTGVAEQLHMRALQIFSIPARVPRARRQLTEIRAKLHRLKDEAIPWWHFQA
jgi:hypothetical protein